MKQKDSATKRSAFLTWALIGIPVLFLVAAPLHFVCDWAGKAAVVGFLAPVNESPWEHLKLTFWPVLLWWIIGWLTVGKKHRYPFARAAVSCAVAEIVSLLFTLSFFYTYTGALGVESLIVDIISVLVALFVGILLAVHVVRRSAPGGVSGFIAVLALLALAAVFIYFTVSPPHVPVFLDRNTGAYGLG